MPRASPGGRGEAADPWNLRYRAALVLRYVEDLSYDEAAAILGQPAGTIRSNVHRGLALLRKALEGDRDLAEARR